MLFMALSMARDEVIWIVRHSAVEPMPKSRGKLNPQDYKDRSSVVTFIVPSLPNSLIIEGYQSYFTTLKS